MPLSPEMATLLTAAGFSLAEMSDLTKLDGYTGLLDDNSLDNLA